jgi:hypothetical protein
LTITLPEAASPKGKWAPALDPEVWKVRQLASENPRERRFHLEPVITIKPGSRLVLRLPGLRYRPRKGPAKRVVWKPIAVRIISEIKDPSLSELRPVTPPEQLPPKWSWRQPLSWALPALVLAAVGLILLELLRRRVGRVSPLTPDAWALRELDRLAGLDLSAARENERFPTLVSDVVRRYLELRYQIHAPRQTTAEFLAAMQQAPLLGPEQQTLLREFLQRCDLAKFARAIPNADECRALAARARAFVEQAQNSSLSDPEEPEPSEPRALPANPS